MIQKLALLAVAGAMGTLARYGLAGLVHRICDTPLPWGTLVVNVVGCFVAGLLWALFEDRWPVSGENSARPSGRPCAERTRTKRGSRRA